MNNTKNTNDNQNSTNKSVGSTYNAPDVFLIARPHASPVGWDHQPWGGATTTGEEAVVIYYYIQSHYMVFKRVPQW